MFDVSNVVVVSPNGPLIARGRIRIEDSDGKTIAEAHEVFLCRCGHSGNKPFCDGAHQRNGFTDAAEFRDEKAETPMGKEALVITVRPHAMLIAKGPMAIQSEDGGFNTTRNKAALCRCGHSNNKPFCDASHKVCGF